MGFIYLLTTIIGESAGYTIDKLNFRRNHIGFRQLMLLGFLVMSVCLLLFIMATRQPFPHLTSTIAGLMGLVIIFSFGGNVFDCLSLKADDLSLREPLRDFEPILAGLVAYVVFPDERNNLLLFAFIVGAFIVHWGVHRRKLRKFQKKGMGYLLLSVILYATLPSIYNEVLIYLSPAYVVFFRVFGILILTSIFFPVKKMRGFTKKRVWYGIASGVVCSAAAIAGLYALQAYGVALTMLFLMLGPALRYLAGQFILKEKVRRGEVLSSLMLTLLVAVVAFVR